MQGFVINVLEETLKNEYFRRVLYTTKNSQLVLMSLKPKERIGTQVHKLDQFIRVEAGEGTAYIDGVERKIKPGFSITVPAGTKHNIINDSKTKHLKLHKVYSPPNHRDGIVHRTKTEATQKKKHFDGETTEK